ncbi:hypothetical protein GCM10020331_031050 [Ectobacillus funiculus]
MRLRHKPYAMEMIETYPQFVIADPEAYKGSWGKLFLEIIIRFTSKLGQGAVVFIYEMAKAHPHINYIGIEKFFKCGC